MRTVIGEGIARRVEMLRELASRIEANPPSRRFDREIAEAMGWTRLRWRESISMTRAPSLTGFAPQTGRLSKVPLYTSDMTAAHTLLASFGSWINSQGRLTPDEPAFGAEVFDDEAGNERIGASESNSSSAACLAAAALRGIAHQVGRALADAPKGGA